MAARVFIALRFVLPLYIVSTARKGTYRQMRKAKLVRARTLTSTVRELTFDPGPDFTFDPGQWVSVRIPASEGEDLARSYSIASAPRGDGTFDLAVTRVEKGPGSNFLHALEVGTSLPISRAQGFFTQDDFERPAVMVATGTGVSPFRSMLEHLDAAGAFPHSVTLLLGIRTKQDVLYGGEFEQMVARRPNLRFEPTLSRGDAEWTGRRGYVQSHLTELLDAYDRECDIYICGVSRMVKDVRKILKSELGITKDRIHSERFD